MFTKYKTNQIAYANRNKSTKPKTRWELRAEANKAAKKK